LFSGRRGDYTSDAEKITRRGQFGRAVKILAEILAEFFARMPERSLSGNFPVFLIFL
jgi:hypothetical protein